MLAAVAYNFKRVMNLLLDLIGRVLKWLLAVPNEHYEKAYGTYYSTYSEGGVKNLAF
jgi:hypothetical protein